ncbi:hypothetical protein LRP50_06505 [Enterovibrio sp. ZSDZ42]|uniref:Uncharacterized protein n=1 Tax=Enterovibrio gelatinilyticus TaxID=2899819 RepID=A0ABT5QXM7_9GAMM|nr:hypothetical protein [Enterovibrio sp. ZSDZ42]MDD1792771.1 hypothetical protein [Enterovibrio sp. ZSDZ42]
MFWKKKKNQDIDLTELTPKAGDTRKFLAGEVVFFSPVFAPVFPSRPPRNGASQVVSPRPVTLSPT